MVAVTTVRSSLCLDLCVLRRMLYLSMRSGVSLHVSRMANGVVQVDVDALSGAVSSAVSQAIRQHTRPNVISPGTAVVTSISVEPGQAQVLTSTSRIGTQEHASTSRIGTPQTQVHASTSSSGRKRR